MVSQVAIHLDIYNVMLTLKIKILIDQCPTLFFTASVLNQFWIILYKYYSISRVLDEIMQTVKRHVKYFIFLVAESHERSLFSVIAFFFYFTLLANFQSPFWECFRMRGLGCRAILSWAFDRWLFNAVFSSRVCCTLAILQPLGWISHFVSTETKSFLFEDVIIILRSLRSRFDSYFQWF